jgi:hypothetical protein
MRRGIILKIKCCLSLFLSILLTVTLGTAFAKDSFTYLIQASPQKNCRHGLHPHPRGGSFSVFLFCDDALGSNIGVILAEPGAGPGKIRLTGPKVWDKWDTNNRFWQEKEWATDVVNFAWSPSFRYVYVATSAMYGDGGFFKLDLKDRVSERLLPKPSAKYWDQLQMMGYLTQIEKLDLKKNVITVGIYSYYPTDKLIARESVPLD